MVDIKRWALRAGAFLTGIGLAYGVSWAVTQPQVEKEKRILALREGRKIEQKINYFFKVKLPHRVEKVKEEFEKSAERTLSTLEEVTEELAEEFFRPKPFTEKSPRLHPRAAKKFKQLTSKRSKDYLEGKVFRTSEFKDLIKEFSAKYDLPYDVFMSIIVVESGGNNYAVSRTGATGLVQMTRTTAKDMNNRRKVYHVPEGLDCLRENVVGEAMDARYVPEISLECGAAFLARVINRADKEFPKLSKSQRTDIAIAAYNGGFGGVSRAMKKSNARNYWQIPAKNAPSQTHSYVPAVRAVQKFLHKNNVLR